MNNVLPSILEIGMDGVEMTKIWLKRSFEKLQSEVTAESQGACASAPQMTPASILNTAYIELLNWDENLQLYPEVSSTLPFSDSA
jgi:hypothetical protein